MPSILVVDDDRAIQEMLVDLLEERGYEVHSCRDGKQVIAKLRKRPTDLLILDVLIPHMNGFVLMEHLRAEPDFAQLPVIMISGIYRSRNHRTEMSTRFKVIEYLDKPLNTERLLGIVEQALGRAEQHPTPDVSDPAIALSAELSDDAVLIVNAEAGEQPVALDRPKKKHKVTLEQSRRRGAQDREAEPARKPEPPDEQLFTEAVSEEKRLVEREARQSFKTSAFLLQGSITKTPVAAVLGNLWHERASGGLLVRNQQIKKIVYLRRGEPVSVRSNKVSECLGRILLHERLITQQECERSLQLMKRSKKRQGEILVEMGCLTKNNLAFALELQLETKLYDMFVWNAGEYRFNSSLDIATTGSELPWSGPGLVVEGIRRTFDETRLRQQMLALLDVPFSFHDDDLDLQSIGFSEREQQATEAIMPPQTTRELLDAMPLDPPDSLRVIYTLVTLQLLKPAA